MSRFDITLTNASQITGNFQSSFPNITQKGGLFPKDEIMDILNQTGCQGIRYYFAKRSTGEISLVLTGVDQNGDMIMGKLKESADTCPPVCSEQNVLNSQT